MPTLESDHLKSKYDTEVYPILTKEQFIAANDLAIRNDYNRALEPEPLLERLATMPEDTKYPVVFSFFHDQGERKSVNPHMRCQIVLGPDGSTAWVDIDMELFLLLDKATPVVH
jgi:hypothetical protein